MIGMPGCRMLGAVMARVPYGDVGAVHVLLGEHPYLRCHDCAGPLDWGPTSAGATVYVCHPCGRILDTRRVD